MNSTFTPSIKYVSHEDFMKVRLFSVLEVKEGTYEDRIRYFDETIKEHYNVYGYCPLSLYREKRDYIRQWGYVWKLSKYILVDIDTGEVMSPVH